MNKILVSVEGQTEEAFAKRLLVPHFRKLGIDFIPVLVKTKLSRSGAAFGGGMPTFGRLQQDLLRLLGDTSAKALTTMYDFYGLPSHYPGVSSVPRGNCFTRVAYIEGELAKALNDPRFIPYLQLHEYEGLLFADPSAVASVLRTSGSREFAALEADLRAIRDQFGSPEEINDGRTTHPSQRIRRLAGSYRKVRHGSLIAERITLDNIRTRCAHFNDWMTRLEALAP